MFKEILRKVGLIREKFFSGFTSSFMTGSDLPAPTNKDYLNSFRASSLVHSCTKKIGEKMSTIEFELYQLRGQTAREVEQHEILDLLSKPNPMMTGSQLQEITAIYLSLIGNCYWYKARNAQGNVIELWLMRPDLTTVIPGKDGNVAQYKFVMGGKQVLFPAEDVIQFKEPDPLSDYYGYSAVQSAMEVIRADVYAKKWNTKFFFNSARPDAILTTEQKIGKADRDEIREKWSNKYGGADNAHKVAVLSHGLDYKQISVTQKDMDFANMRIANRDDVISALAVPKSILAITDDVSRANADAGIYVFLSENIRPKMEKMTDILNLFLVNEFGIDLILLSLDPTPDDNTAKDDHYVKAHNRWLTTNEIRIEQGYDPIDGGDSIYQGMGLVVMGETADTGENNTDDNKKTMNGIIKIGNKFSAKDFYLRKKEKKLQDIYKRAMRGRKILRLQEDLIKDVTIEVTKNITKALKDVKKKEVKELTKKQKDIIWKKFDERLKGWDKKFKKMTVGLFEAQQVRALEKLKKLKIGKSVNADKLGLLDFKKEVKIFSKEALPMMTEILKEAGDLALEQVGKKSIKKEFEISDPVTVDWLKNKSITFAEEVNETTIEKLKNKLSAGILEGESIDELAKRVLEVYELRINSSSKTIARTEVLSSNNAGTVFGYKQSGVVAKKEWLSTLDSRTRDSHSSMNGEVVLLNKNFSNGLEYPGDPNGDASDIINCRCTVIPVISE